MKQKLLLCLAFLLSMSLSYAQTLVRGTVTAVEDNSPVPGVSVLVKGTTTGTVTDSQGKYSLNVPAGSTVLVFKSIGFIMMEMPIGNNSVVDVQLKQDAKDLEEVVVQVPYGQAKKALFTGSVNQLSTKDFQTRPISNINNALAGVAAGIQASAGSGQPGDGPSIRVRGFGSINASNEPLYVVDGVPYSGNIANLNPSDIESISLLKDASSSSIYGSRAANGVIMVTTRKGSNKSQFTINASQGVMSRGIPEYDRVNAFEYYPLMWEAYRNSLSYGAPAASAIGLDAANARATAGIKGLLGYNPFNVADNEIVTADGKINPNARLKYGNDLDWAEPLTRQGSRSDYNLNYSGGSDKSDYFVSMGYVNEKGYLINSDFKRYTGRINANFKPLKWLKTGLNLAGTVTDAKQANTVDNSSGYANPFNFARGMGPIYPVYARNPQTGELILDQGGNAQYDLGNMTALGLSSRPAGANPGRHIVAETELNKNIRRRNVLSARTYGEVTFLKDFKFTTNISVDITSDLGIGYDNTLVGDGAPAGRARRTNRITSNYNLNQLLNYSKTINKHHTIDALLGHENYDWTYNYIYAMSQGQIVTGIDELGNFTTPNSSTSYTDKYRTEGYFSRVNYDYDGKYILSASFRRDGSSKFARDSRWGNFWSVGAGWRLDNENFMKSLSWVNLLKLRSSVGTSGNDGVLDADGNRIYYAYQALYGIGQSYNNNSEPGFLQTKLAANNLQWESNRSIDVGLEYGLLNNRLSGSVEVFHRKSDNLLFSVPITLGSGMAEQLANIGSMWNKGIELHVNADIIRKKDFRWNIDVNATMLKNRITSLPENNKPIISGSFRRAVGQSIYDFWLREWYGVDSENGDGLYRADQWVNNTTTKTYVIGQDTVTNNSNNARFHYAGSSIPDVYGGISNTFNYKRFTLTALLNYQLGGLALDNSYAQLMAGGNYGTALHKDQLKRWQNPGDVTDVPRMDEARRSFFNAASDRWLTSASYLSIRSVNLSYSFAPALLNRINVKNASVFVSGENLWLFSARKGMNVAQQFNGIVNNAYIPNRVVSVGLNLTL